MTTRLLLSLCLTVSLIVTFQHANAESTSGASAFKQGAYQKAYEIWLKAAQNGDADAQFNVAVMLENGQGIPRDLFSALKWYELAARQNYPHALGMSEKVQAKITRLHKRELLKHLPKADAGDSLSQIAVATIYAEGRFVKQDKLEALKWLILAAETVKNPTTIKRVNRLSDRLKEDLTEEQIVEVQQRVEAWHKLREPVQ
ncbi:hypothetical protein GUA87_16410 [Sneathiella sp. P13V-1]|uniref:tetratricopeptide repeat protein n=1 Tax=Sneathiella sp. P13V-1 TaxID=2697366 RepID=UPI00187B3C1D|nr:tetratricopeptide repeat protein [Sneathiella sp. P13V-1]MBE7638441.1 hypothetical protein [Sneathiella sp. P13V-1]